MDTTIIVLIGIIIIVGILGFSLGTRAEAPGLLKKEDCQKRHIWFFGWWVQCTGTCTDKNKQCRLLIHKKGEERWSDPRKWGTRWNEGYEYTCDCRRRS